MIEKIGSENKSFCMAPWMSIHVWPDGKTFPCCLWDVKEPLGNINDSSLMDIWNSDKMKEARVKMLKGEKLSACSRCYHLEESNFGSYRKDLNKRHGDKIEYIDLTKEDGSLEDINLHLWDFRLSNFCNFKCRSCGFGLSSSWYSDTKELAVSDKLKEINSEYYNNPDKSRTSSLISVNDKISFLELLEPHYNCVDEVYFAGGEPLMMPEHYQILDKLLENNRTDILLRYSTNFSKLTFKDKHVFDYWKHFPNLQLWMSIDGVGKIGEYVRKGYNDSVFENNIKEFKESGITPPDIGYMITYGALNYLHLFDMIINFIERDYVDYKEPFQGNKLTYFSPISYPKCYDSAYLPFQYKEQFRVRLSNFDKELEKAGASEFFIKDVITKLTTVYERSIEQEFNYDHMLECKTVTEELDRLRKEKFADIFPYFNSTEDLITNIQPLI